MSNTIKTGAAYEAVLTDNVTARVDKIIASLDRLQEKFKETARVTQNASKVMGQFGRTGAFGRGRGGAGGAGGMGGFGDLLTTQGFGRIGPAMMRAATVVNTASQAIGQAMIHVGSQMRMVGVIATATSGALTAFFVSAIRVAGDAEETISAFNAVFRRNAREVDAWAKTFSGAVNRSTNATRDGLRTFQSFFVGMGFGADEAAEMSKEMQSLTIDFASFFNLTDEEGMRRMIGGLSGASENLLRFGINVQEAQLSLTKYAKAIGKTADEMTQFEKANARMEIIVDTMKELNATGDAFRTRFSFQNQLKALTAAFRELQQVIGKQLMKDAKELVATLVVVINQVKDAGISFKGIAGAVGLLGAGGASLIAIGTAMSAIGVAGLALASVISSLLAGLAAFLSLPVLGMAAALAAAHVSAKGLLRIFQGLVESTSRFDPNQFFSALKKGAEELGETFSRLFEDAGVAMRAGDYELAWRLFVKEAKNAIDVVGNTFKEMFEDVFLFAEAYFKAFINRFITDPVLGPTIAAMLGRKTLGDPLKMSARAGEFEGFDPEQFVQLLRRLQEIEADQARQRAERENAGKTQDDLDQELLDIYRQQEGVLARTFKRFGEKLAGWVDAIPKGKTFQDQLDEVSNELSTFANNVREGIRMAFQPNQYTYTDPNPELLTGPARPTGRIIRELSSVGGFGAGFAGQAAAFAPVMAPVERELESLNTTAKKQEAHMEKIADWTDTFGTFQ